MPRRLRIHIPGGTYYVRQSNVPHPIFAQPDDYLFLESLLPMLAKRGGVQVLAFCWMPESMHLALRIGESPLGDFMRELTCRYARHVNRRTGEPGQFFRNPYKATLIDPDEYLLDVIRYLHNLPVVAGCVGDPVQYPHSSHRAYLGREHRPWVDASSVLECLPDGARGPHWHDELDSPIARERFRVMLERGDRHVPGVLGSAEFCARLPRRGRPVRSSLSLDDITAYVARSHDVPHAFVRSRSRRRTLVLARARIAWYATERRVANLCEVARYLGHSPSSLTRAITRHQSRQPELFAPELFVPLVPLARAGARLAPGQGDYEDRARRAFAS